jgi:serine protease AprX
MADGSTATAPFWQVGYGYVNLDRAVSLVRGDGWRTRLADASATADARVLASDGQKVSRGDFWSYDAPRLAAGGSDTHSYTAPVATATQKLFVSLAHPSLGTVGANLTSYTVTVSNPKGKVVGTTTESATAGSGTATALVDLRKAASPAGTYTFTVVGNYAASDPDTLDSDSVLGRSVTLHVAQLTAG